MKKIVEWGTLLLVFLLPWQTRWIFAEGLINGNANEYLTKSLYGVDILLVATLAISIFFHRKNIFSSIHSLMEEKASWLCLLFFAWAILSIFWADNRGLAVERNAWFLLTGGLAWLVFEFEEKFKLIWWFLLGMLISAWLGIWQFFAQSAFANKWLGLASHKVTDGGVAYLEIHDKSQHLIHWLRSYGSFDHPNIFGFAMMVGILFSFWLILQGEKNKFKNIFLYFSLASFSFGLFASLSRSAFAGMILALGVILLKVGFSKMKKLLAILFLVFAMFSFFHSDLIFARSDVTARLEQKSINERELYLQQGEEIIKNNVWFGVGAGNYVSKLKQENPDKLAWELQPVHNFFLLVWAELGFFAMLVTVTLLIFLAKFAWQKGAFPFAIVVSFLPTMMLDHWLWDLHFGVILLGFVVGILMNKTKTYENWN